jgi:formylglycine-generating enzyme required for sulfatase activity
MKKAVWFLFGCYVLPSLPVIAVCPSADLTGDCYVDLEDFAVLSSQWTNNMGALDLLVSQWLTGNRLPMVSIPAGTFQMGDSGYLYERPIHMVTLDSFSMGKYEITNGQYCAFLKSAYPSQLRVIGGVVYASSDTGNSFPYCDTSISSSYSQIVVSNNTFSVRTKGGRSMVNDPMVQVSWYGAVAYCNWRSGREGRQPCYNLTIWTCDYTKNGYRLPTEAEWEYAARGGLYGKRFPLGDTIIHSQANYYSYWEKGKPYYPYDLSPTEGFHPTWDDGGYPYTSQVGSFPANAYGLCDMAGNVEEWCQDWYGGYWSSSQTNPTGPTTGSCRVIRGGGWYGSYLSGSTYCRVSHRRTYGYPDSRYYDYGFRVVLDLK